LDNEREWERTGPKARSADQMLAWAEFARPRCGRKETDSAEGATEIGAAALVRSWRHRFRLTFHANGRSFAPSALIALMGHSYLGLADSA
jgi:hypothetical protein